jgi:hypothetical protein
LTKVLVRAVLFAGAVLPLTHMTLVALAPYTHMT